MRVETAEGWYTDGEMHEQGILVLVTWKLQINCYTTLETHDITECTILLQFPVVCLPSIHVDSTFVFSAVSLACTGECPISKTLIAHNLGMQG